MPFVPDQQPAGRFVPDTPAKQPPVTPPVTALDRANAAASGVNSGVASILGLPMDTAANVVDLGKIGLGIGYHELTGNNVPDALTIPADRSGVVGTGDWIRKIMNQVPGQPAAIPRPDDPASRYLHAAGSAVPAAMTARPTGIASATRALAANALPAVAGQGAAEMLPDSPSARIAATLATQAAPGAARGVVRGAARTVNALAPDAEAIANARAAGYKITPKEANQPVGAAVEGLAGSAALERSVSKQNQRVSNRLAREEVGLKGDAPIKATELDDLRAKANQAYDDLGKTGRVTADPKFQEDLARAGGSRTQQMQSDFPDAVNAEIEGLKQVYNKPDFDAQSAIQATRQLRAHASKNIKAEDPAKNDLGWAQKDIADAFDSMLQRHAESLGKPELAQNFRNARVQLAKVHTVEDARNETTGNIQAPVLGKMLERGAYLSGKLKTIAQTARAAPKSTQSTEKLPNEHILGSAFDLGLGTIGAGTAAFAHLPGVAAIGALRPATRALLRSDMYQQPKPFSASPEMQLSYLTQLVEMSPEERRKAIAEAMQ